MYDLSSYSSLILKANDVVDITQKANDTILRERFESRLKTSKKKDESEKCPYGRRNIFGINSSRRRCQ